MTRPNRLEFLEDLVAKGKADSFARYALALEYAKLQRYDNAVSTFHALREGDPSYLPMYLMAGKVLSEQGQVKAAREWVEAGLSVSKAKNDPKTHGELSELLSTLGA
ncbi:MAG: tetratricopeptide repeat protein [Polyangiaceae bacterium]